MQMKKYFIHLFFTLGIIVYISACALFYPPKTDRYYFPELYRGWVCVQYNVKNAPPLPVEDGYLIHKIPENGLLITSSAPRMVEPHRAEYYYYSTHGVRKAKELQHGGGYAKQQKIGSEEEIKLYFWISCCGHIESDYDIHVKNQIDTDTDPVCGRWDQKK
jgi:hypothetical protein